MVVADKELIKQFSENAFKDIKDKKQNKINNVIIVIIELREIEGNII